MAARGVARQPGRGVASDAAPGVVTERRPGVVTDGYIHNLKLKDVPLSTTLDVMLRQLNLDYSVEGNIIWISTPERIRHEAWGSAVKHRAAPMGVTAETLPKVLVSSPR